MERKFKVKFDSKEAYHEGMAKFMNTLDVWKSNEEKFIREYDIVPDIDTESNKYNLNITIEVTD